MTEAEELELLELERQRALSQNSAPQTKGIMGNAWDALAIPEQKSREGLGILAGLLPNFEPTGNTFRDVALNTPRILGETVAEVAPSFVSRGSILTAGALKGAQMASPAIGAVGKFLGRTAESTSGLGYKTPGVLAETVENPGLLFGKGVEKAREGYKAIQNVNQISPDLQRTSNLRDFVTKALKMVDENNLNPDEALEARKALDNLDDVPDVFRKQTRNIFNAIAKQKFEEADKAYAKAIKSDALRNFWALNKGGTPSIAKGSIMLGIGQGALSPILSPMVQGGMAAGIGIAKKAMSPLVQNPSLGFLPDPILERFR